MGYSADPEGGINIERRPINDSQIPVNRGRVVHLGGKPWLRIPVGKLRNDRMIPLHADLAAQLETWTATNTEHIANHQRLIADHRGRINRYSVSRIVARIARHAGIGHVHPPSSATPWPPKPSTEACA